ncbi:MbnP family protein [Winogradskyella forsetii]|uniref:MbnP family protein n=1 Tax=Winogradskyella forsetii TaxID=2686077 RepID=UPI0015BEA104|nr:MbnP family protein [Winogradskyella forsetii]
MKILKYTFALLACTMFTNCSSEDDNDNDDLTGQTGELVLKFDNAVGDQDFIFGTTYSKSNSESFQLSNVKYIISNVRVTDTEGNTFMYPTEDNVFIVSELDGNNAGEIWVTLNGVDAADYSSITFGVGIDQDRFLLGADGQGDFLDLASDEGMMWSWASGYKFVRFDGTFSSTTATDAPLNIHMGSVGTSLDNYKEVTLIFPNTVLVRENKSPEIHIKADISKVFDGVTAVNFSEGYDQVHTDVNETPIIASNVQTMFQVHHVHND